MSRPSLKIMRHDDRETGWFDFEVWNPITGSYEPVASLDDGLNRVTELAEQVRLRRVQRDPARKSFMDAPDPADDDNTEWAELRVSGQVKAVETRNFDRPVWKKAWNRIAAIQTICDEVGYTLP